MTTMSTVNSTSPHNNRQYGKLTEYQLASEASLADCPDQIFFLVLLLRRIVGKRAGVFYKTQWDVGINDGDHNDVTLYIYRPDSVPALREVAWLSHDSAQDVRGESFQTFGSIESVSFETTMGRALGSNVETLQLLMSTAAAIARVAISFVQLRPGEIQILLGDDGTVDHVGTILTNDHLPAGQIGSDNIALRVN